jgi:hypothetical protein
MLPQQSGGSRFKIYGSLSKTFLTFPSCSRGGVGEVKNNGFSKGSNVKNLPF